MSNPIEMSDEEFMEFINANKERMNALMGGDDGFKAQVKSTAKRAKAKVDKAEDAAEDTAKKIFKAIFSEDVQKHMIGAGVELVLGINALFKAMPVPESARKVTDKLSEIRSNASKAYCAKNPDCPRRNAEAKKAENIKIELD